MREPPNTPEQRDLGSWKEIAASLTGTSVQRFAGSVSGACQSTAYPAANAVPCLPPATKSIGGDAVTRRPRTRRRPGCRMRGMTDGARCAAWPGRRRCRRRVDSPSGHRGNGPHLYRQAFARSIPRVAARHPGLRPEGSRGSYRGRWHSLEVQFDGPLADLPVEGFGRRYAIADLDGDGREEVVATVTRSLETGILQDELLCFNSTGDVRWRTRLEDRVAFRSGTFGPPWFNGWVAVYSVAGQPRIAWAQSQFTWWPAVLAVLDGSGRRLSTFVQSGQIGSWRWSTDRRAPSLVRQDVQRLSCCEPYRSRRGLGGRPLARSARVALRVPRAPWKARRCATSSFRPRRSRPRAPSPTTSCAS